MAEVTLTDITKRFGGFTAVDDISMVIEDERFTVLVGPSGCGKATALRMVAGLEDITEGEIKIGKRVVNRVPPKDRDIAMVFQNYALYPHMDVCINVAFGLKLRKTPKKEIQQRVNEADKLVGIESKLKSKPRELSGDSANAWPSGVQSSAIQPSSSAAGSLHESSRSSKRGRSRRPSPAKAALRPCFGRSRFTSSSNPTPPSAEPPSARPPDAPTNAPPEDLGHHAEESVCLCYRVRGSRLIHT